ncbi:DedA family protein [Cellulomonas pakistanensis]|uniref:Membrane protein n=1 Tax=Cellulomonas pakistanensis TaxID=992287 RepID=A0A919U342_9CELL|nr:DedA family protein [Cellulomonas pakistanensis]GIG35891.1 membrane protein [Cellulomonas pakistanensis]
MHLLDPGALLGAFGVAGIFVVLLLETGLLIGFLLPGDTLLLAAGVLSAGPAHTLPLGGVLVAATAGALLGAQAGYALGRAGGRWVLRSSPEGRLRAALDRSGAMVERYGTARTIVLARFVPVVRTVINPLAGMTRVPLRTFTVWQVVGGAVWACAIPLAGWALGTRVPGLERYVTGLVVVAVGATVVTSLAQWLRTRGARRGAAGPADG